MYKIRAHHLLCLRLFSGIGYSDVFTENMQHIAAALQEDGDSKMEVSNHVDSICTCCPNQTMHSTCCLNDDDVVEKDNILLRSLLIKSDTIWSYHLLARHVIEEMTQQLFIQTCSTCRWYKQGVCSYELWKYRTGCLR